MEIITTDFEGWETAATFDAVVAFTAFHWIDANIRYEKCARHLSDTGALAVVETRHVLAPDGDQFFVDVQQDYELLCPSDPQTTAGPPGPPEDVGDLRSEIDGSGVFRATFVGRYLWDVAYRADEYITVLETYSGHRAIDDDTRERLYQRIRRRITSRPSCLVTKNVSGHTERRPEDLAQLLP